VVRGHGHAGGGRQWSAGADEQHRASQRGADRALDIAPIYQTAEVLQIHTYLLNQQGEDAMIEAEQMRDERLDELAAQAQECVRQRKTVH
jgi:hypothetical protein